MNKKLAVIALGGYALLRGDEIGTIEEQETNTLDTLRNLMFLVREGYDIILTHGNGPQVGNILMRNDAGEQLYDIAPMPLDVCVGDSQGGIGYMLERILRNLLREEGLDRNVVTVVSQVLVAQDDPAFQNPTKPIGKVYSRSQAIELTAMNQWVFRETPKGGWRRNVPSPMPLNVLNAQTVEGLARLGNIVIAGGGGGVPVSYNDKKSLRPVEGLVDKDLTSSVLANQVKADELYILTDVPYVYLNYKKENQEVKKVLNAADTRAYYEGGHFGRGSMAPKVKACLNFVEHGGAKAIITQASKLKDKSFGSTITLNYEA